MTERIPGTVERVVQAAKTGHGVCRELTHVRRNESEALFARAIYVDFHVCFPVGNRGALITVIPCFQNRFSGSE